MKNLILENSIFIYALLAILLFSLSIYLGYLFKLLKAQKSKNEENQIILKNFLTEKRADHQESIIFIAKATLQGQCEISEACIRIKKLLEVFGEYTFHEDLVPIYNFYNALSSFAYLDDRAGLSKQDMFKQDSARFKVEEEHKESFMKSLSSLLTIFEAN